MGSKSQSNLDGSQGSMEKATPLRIWHCSHPRSASNVLAKQFRDHPQLAPKEYTFMSAWMYGPERLQRTGHSEATIPNAEQLTFQKGFDELQQFLLEIEEQGKIIFIKEHINLMLDPNVAATQFPTLKGIPCPQVVDQHTTDLASGSSDSVNANGVIRRTNPSVLPDTFIRTLSPILQIRHPAIAVPSFYRALSKAQDSVEIFNDFIIRDTTFAWERLVFDWYCEHVNPQRKQTPRGHASWPLIIDGDDLVNDNERIISAICSLANLDVKGVTMSWKPVSEEVIAEQRKGEQIFLSTLQSSNGVIKNSRREGELSIEKEAEKWKEEFGAKVAGRLQEVAEAGLPDYMYLMQYRV